LPEQSRTIVTMRGSKQPSAQVQFTAHGKGAVTSKTGSFDFESVPFR
jgi:hypothetical protein